MQSSNTLSAWPLRRLPALAILVLAAAMLWLQPADPAQAQNAAGPKITAGPTLNTPVVADRFSNIYGHGEEIVVSFSFSEPVVVTGAPRVALTIGAFTSWAGYSGSSDDGATLSFTHTVVPDDWDYYGLKVAENALELNGGAINSAGGVAANLSHPAVAPGNTHLVDGAITVKQPVQPPAEEPTVQSQIQSTPPRVSSGPILNSPASGNAYLAGEEILVSLTFSEPVTVTGSPRVALAIGDATRWAQYQGAGGDGATQNFTYTVAPADRDDDGLSVGANALELNGGAINSAGGNPASLEHPETAPGATHLVDGSPDEPTPTPEPEPEQPANSEPQFAADSAARGVDEHAAAGTSVGAPIVASDGDGDALTYALSGADAGSFEMDAASGQISVKNALDYETRSGYALTVTVHDGKDASGEADTSIDDSISVRISVVNVDEPGVVSLVSQSDPSATVEVGSELSAVLLDPDGGVSGAAWTWQRSADRLDWQGIADAGAAAYTPSAADLHYYLRATVAYADGHGAGKSAAAVSAGPAQAAVTRAPDALPQTTPVTPAKPQNFRAEPGHVEVTLKWDDPSDDSITRYQYRQRVGGTRGDWMDIPGSSATTTAYTIRGLTSETTYIFAVRARGTGTARFGKEAKASATTTAAPVPRCPKPDGVTTAPPTLAQATTVTEGIKRDCNTLLAVKATLEGADGPTLNWAYGTDLADWEGVGIYEDQIEQLDLSHKGLKGTLPPALAQLSALQSLDLSGNMLTGSIPDLSALATLQKLTLGGNNLTGSIPSTLGALVNLVELHLNDNREVIYHRDPNGTLLTRGRHPVTGAQGKFRAEVVKEGLSGTIPDLSALSKLERLDLSFNNLSGEIPTWLGELTALEYAWLGNNALSGPIPVSLGCYPPPALRELQLSHNQLSGEIPASLGRIATLRMLTMSGDSFEPSATHKTNKFTGTIPTTIQRLRITSPTPDELRRLVGLEWGTGDASSCSKPVIRGEPRVYLTLSRTELAEGTADFSRRYPDRPRGRDNPPDTNFADVGARLDQEAEYDIVVDLALPDANLGYELTHHRLLIPAGQKTSSAAGPVVQLKTIDDQVYRSGVIELEGAASGALKAFAPGSVKRISDESLVHGKKDATLRPVCQTGSNRRDCDGGGNGDNARPTLHGPERVVFSITENEPLPVVSLEVSGDPFEGDTVTLTARVYPRAAYDIVVTVNTPPAALATLDESELMIPAGQFASEDSITVSLTDNDYVTPIGEGYPHRNRFISNRVTLSAEASGYGPVADEVNGVEVTIWDDDARPMRPHVGLASFRWKANDQSQVPKDSFTDAITLNNANTDVLATPRLALSARDVDVRVKVKRFSLGDRDAANYTRFPDAGIWMVIPAGQHLSSVEVSEAARITINPAADDPDWDSAEVYVYIDPDASIQCRKPGGSWVNVDKSDNGKCPVSGDRLRFKAAARSWARVTVQDPEQGVEPVETRPAKRARLSFTPDDEISAYGKDSARIKIELDYGRTKPSADTKFKVYVPRPIEGRANFYSLEQDSECTYQGPFCILELTITKNQSSVTSDLVIRGQYVWVWKFYHELEISAEKLSGDGGVGWYRGSDRATLEVGN